MLIRGGSRILRNRGRQPSRGAPTFPKNTAWNWENVGSFGAPDVHPPSPPTELPLLTVCISDKSREMRWSSYEKWQFLCERYPDRAPYCGVISFKRPFGGFNFKFLEDISPFCGVTDIPLWALWSSSPACNEFLRFTSGATPADRLMDNGSRTCSIDSRTCTHIITQS